jgi:Putative restriction endonuclease
MAKYLMQVIRFVPVDPEAAVQHGEWDDGLVNFTLRDYRPVERAPLVVIDAADLNSAKEQAAKHWRDQQRDPKVDGYWIIDEDENRAHIYDHQIEADIQLAKARSH